MWRRRDARALADPLVVGVDQGLELGVVHDPHRAVVADAEDAGAGSAGVASLTGGPRRGAAGPAVGQG